MVKRANKQKKQKKRFKNSHLPSSVSIVWRSFEKREITRPMGVTSKNEVGAFRTERKAPPWRLLEARILTNAMDAVRIKLMIKRRKKGESPSITLDLRA